MKVTTKGQVTIPKQLREKYGIGPHSEVQFLEHRGRIYLEKTGRAEGPNPFETARGTATLKMSTDEILALTRGWDDDR
jgi:AbrB family looped-hinge helix DNA binding protein